MADDSAGYTITEIPSAGYWASLKGGIRVTMSGREYDALCEFLQTIEDADANRLASVPAGEHFRAFLLTEVEGDEYAEVERAAKSAGL